MAIIFRGKTIKPSADMDYLTGSNGSLDYAAN